MYKTKVGDTHLPDKGAHTHLPYVEKARVYF